ncbi:MAG: hypothetical protein DRP09_17510 [Candidatus Thorarchaeota archaeon]|nr:MAG: hypothetical protein DRP09_17510 [Candidatus Thorarchaeota archaeon]
MRMKIESKWACLGAYIVLFLLWGLLVVGGRQLSFSMDEPAHITRGYTFLARWKDGFWYFPLESHPPLLNIAEALLTYLSHPNIPLETLDGWGKNFISYKVAFTQYLAPLERTEILARTPVMALTVLLGALVFRWGEELVGNWSGLLALTVLAFDPLVLAHGRLATTDMGVTAIGTAALYAGWRWLKSSSWKWTVITGGLLGLTMLSKFSGFLWCLSFGLMALGVILLEKQSCWRRISQMVVIGLTTLLLVWGGLGFSIGKIGIFPFPVPASMYWNAVIAQTGTTGQRVFFAFGKIWKGQHWWYFPLNFLIKNPLPLLISSFTGLWIFLRSDQSRSRLLTIGLFPSIYILVSIVEGMNVSYRHMLPVHPFLYLVIAAGLGSYAKKREPRGWKYLFWGILGGWYILGTLGLYPDEITYFNEIVGGPERGYRYLVDYTQDWGQSHKELWDYLRTYPGPEPQVAHYTRLHPGFYGVSFRSIFPSTGSEKDPAPFYPQPGRYVIGVAPLYGLTNYYDHSTNLLSGEMEWFRRATPTAMVGHALFVYDVKTAPQWVAQCIVPAVPLDDIAIADGFDRTNLRRVDFDCTTAWIYPGGNDLMGVYVLHQALLSEQDCCLLRCDPLPDSPFVARHLTGTHLSYEQRRFSLLPAFALYEWEGDSLSFPQSLSTHATFADTPPVASMNVSSLSPPVSMDGPLSFLGVKVYPNEDCLEVETWWQVTGWPITRSFSIMAHLLNPEGVVLEVADGLGVSPLTLAAGDVVVQRHRFSRPVGETEVWLRTGVYWLDTMERWGVTDVPGTDSYLVHLELKR